MGSSKKCGACNTELSSTSKFCPNCGEQIEQAASLTANKSIGSISTKSGLTTLLLAVFLGWVGAHRFYVGKMGTALLMIATLGGFGIWTMVDLIFIVRNEFTDDDDKPIILTKNPSSAKKAAMTVGAVISGLLLFALTIIIIAFYMTSGLTDTVKSQLSALRQGDMIKAYSYTSKDFQKATSLEEFKKFVGDYPSLKYNKSASFYEREVNNNYGTLKGSLKASDGAVTPVEYRLIKEDGTWKILGVIVSPTGAGTSEEFGKDQESEKTSSANDTSLSKTYSHQKFKLNYPSNWEYAEPENGTVVFRIKGSDEVNYAYISIQTVYSKKLGGKFAKLSNIVSDLKRQLPKNFSNTTIESTGDIELPNNHAYHGQYVISTYRYENQMVKQMDVILSDPDGSYFYVWEYATPENQYETYMPIAKAMFESWIIR